MDNFEKINDDVMHELMSLKDEKYQKFASSLIPGVNNLIGVRIPNIRTLAKKIVSLNNESYLYASDEIFFEEKMLKGLIIGNLKCDFNEILKHVELFVPKIDNWSICDSFCSELKIFRKNKYVVWNFLKKYIESDKIYDNRFAIAVLIFHFRSDDEYIDEILKICGNMKNEDYYVKMSVAWCFSMYYFKYPVKVYDFLNLNKIDDETLKMTVRKIKDSRQVSFESKKIVSKLLD